MAETGVPLKHQHSSKFEYPKTDWHTHKPECNNRGRLLQSRNPTKNSTHKNHPYRNKGARNQSPVT